MDRVTTFNSYSTILANLMRAESRQTEAQNQVATGKRANDFKGFAGDAESLTAARTLKTRVDGFVAGAKALENRLASQALALNQVGDAAQAARNAVASAIANGRADGLMSALESLFGQSVQGLNTQYGGVYLFAGGQSATKPVSAGSLAELAAAASSADVFENDQLAATQRLDEATTLQHRLPGRRGRRPAVRSVPPDQGLRRRPRRPAGRPADPGPGRLPHRHAGAARRRPGRGDRDHRGERPAAEPRRSHGQGAAGPPGHARGPDRGTGRRRRRRSASRATEPEAP